jgi:hypothetical protein
VIDEVDVIDFCKMCSLFKSGKCKGVHSQEQMRLCGCLDEM